MGKDQLAETIRRRLKLDDKEWTVVKENPKFQRLFKNAMKASKYQLVAEVIDSKGCHSGHVIGQKLIFDNTGPYCGGWGHVVVKMSAVKK